MSKTEVETARRRMASNPTTTSARRVGQAGLEVCGREER
jgi:hypothetical protein